MSSNIEDDHHREQHHIDSNPVIDPFLSEKRNASAKQAMSSSGPINRSLYGYDSSRIQKDEDEEQQEQQHPFEPHRRLHHRSFQMSDFPEEDSSHLSPPHCVDEFLDEIVEDISQTGSGEPYILSPQLSRYSGGLGDGNQLNAGDDVDSSQDTPISRNLIDLSDNDGDIDRGEVHGKNQYSSTSNSPCSLTAVANPNEHLIDSYGAELVPEVIVRESDQTTLSDKLSGDSLFDSSNGDGEGHGDATRHRNRRIVASFRQPLQSRTSQPQATLQPSALCPFPSHHVGSSPVSPVSPSRSRISNRTSVCTPRSETYFHTYETNLEAPTSQVPPFVVVHRTGHAIVKITPKGATFAISRQRTLYEEDTGSITSNLPCRVWFRPIIMMIMVGIVILGAVTVAAGVIKSREIEQVDNGPESMTPPRGGSLSSPSVPVGVQPVGNPQSQVPPNDDNGDFGIDLDPGEPRPQAPSIAPADSGVSFPTKEPESGASPLSPADLDVPNDDNETSPTDGVVKLPYEETSSPAFVPPTRPPRPPQPVPTAPPSPPQGDDSAVSLPSPPPTFIPPTLPIIAPVLPSSASPTGVATSFPSSPPTVEQVPWSSYVIGLISTRSPHSFAELDDPSSPQYQGLKWISLDLSEGAGYDSNQSLQRWAMATLYFATQGESWSDNTAWLTTSHECNWYGASCDESYHLTALDLDSNNLEGKLPVELDLLVDLQFLVLSKNKISGTLSPSYSKIDHLQEFTLSDNKLTGSIPWEYSNWDLLATLDLSQNELTGIIPSELGEMNSLVSLNLCSNGLTGTIPARLGELIYLNSLQLGNNQLMGEVPEQVCDNVKDSIQIAREATAHVVVDCLVGCSCCNGGCCEAANGSNGGYSVTQPVCCSV